jgi:pyridoxine kinase
MKINRVLAIHDLCSFGRCSLTAAIPVLSAMGHQVCPFPTALYSNNLTYGKFFNKDVTPFMENYMKTWEELGLSFDAIYSGFLANAQQAAVVASAIDRFGSDKPVIVDPAMGDGGKLYPVFDDSMVDAMRALVSKATLITPNYTEACFLADLPYSSEPPTNDQLEALCDKLIDMGPSAVVLTSVPYDDQHIRIVSQEKSQLFPESYVVERLPLATCGTGDIFTSALVGYHLKGKDLNQCVQGAADFVSYVIQMTLDSGRDPREGVVLEGCLWKLLMPATKNCTTCTAR